MNNCQDKVSCGTTKFSIITTALAWHSACILYQMVTFTQGNVILCECQVFKIYNTLVELMLSLCEFDINFCIAGKIFSKQIYWYSYSLNVRVLHITDFHTDSYSWVKDIIIQVGIHLFYKTSCSLFLYILAKKYYHVHPEDHC